MRELRPIARDEVAGVTPRLLETGFFRHGEEVAALAASEAWRIQVSGDDLALVRRHSFLPILLIEAVWCAEGRLPGLVESLTEVAAGHGATRMLSPFVDGLGAAGYRKAGMTVHTEIVAMRAGRPAPHSDLDALRVEHGTAKDRERLLSFDAAVFDPFWRLDDEWMDRSLPESRIGFIHGDRGLAGYVMWRVQDRMGHIQRLAVHPSQRRHGLGRALLAFSLAEMRHERARGATVNTQEENVAARSLYRQAGFVETPEPLLVLVSDIL